jgi:hypothetical protein
MRAAAAITSITMNGGTSLRAEGLINRRAASNICSVLSIEPRQPAPLSPHFYAQFPSQRSRNQTLIVVALTALRRTTRLRGKTVRTKRT